MTSNSEKKEQSQTEFIVIVALVGVMMAIFINYYFKNETQFTHTGFASVAQNFNTKVNAVHAQWMMDRHPNIVYLASLNKDKKQAISVNKAGWIDVTQQPLPCEKIWQFVMEVPMSSMKFSVSAIEVNTANRNYQNKHSSAEINLCRYVLREGSFFQYNRGNGKVSKVMKTN